MMGSAIVAVSYYTMNGTEENIHYPDVAKVLEMGGKLHLLAQII